MSKIVVYQVITMSGGVVSLHEQIENMVVTDIKFSENDVIVITFDNDNSKKTCIPFHNIASWSVREEKDNE